MNMQLTHKTTTQQTKISDFVSHQASRKIVEFFPTIYSDIVTYSVRKFYKIFPFCHVFRKNVVQISDPKLDGFGDCRIDVGTISGNISILNIFNLQEIEPVDYYRIAGHKTPGLLPLLNCR